MLNLNKNLKIIILLIKYILNYILYKKNNKSYYLLLIGHSKNKKSIWPYSMGMNTTININIL